MLRVYNNRMSPNDSPPLKEALRRVSEFPGVAKLIDKAASSAPRVAEQMQRAVRSEVQGFSQSRNPDILPELEQHARDLTQEILRLLRGGRPGDFEFIHQHARRRAEQRFPIEATLHAYRSGHKLVSRWLCDHVTTAKLPAAASQAIMAALVDVSMEFVDIVSTSFASAYSAHALMLADIAGDQRSDLLRILLDGHDEADLRAAKVLREAGFLDERQFFCVALARSVDPTEMLDASRARRMADAIEQIVAELGVRRLIDVHQGKVTMVFAAVSRDSGWTAPRTSLAKRIRSALNLVGNAALIGVSNDVPSTSHIPTAYCEAKTALELSTVSRRVVQFSDIALRHLLLHFAAPELHRVLPIWAVAFYQADGKARGALSETLRTYASCDMNILKTAQKMAVHPNTLYARLMRIQDISGLQPRSFDALNELLIVCDLAHRDGGGAAENGARIA